MGTPARICFKTDENTYKSIWCKYDGYLKHVGVILKEHYNTSNKVQKLMKLGDLISLGSDLNSCDLRGCSNYIICSDESQLHTEPYVYLFKNNKWYVAEADTNYKFKLITKKLIDQSWY